MSKRTSTAIVPAAASSLTLALPAVGNLDAYISAVNRLPMLTAERESELARNFRERQDLDAARELVLSHLRLVVSVARQYLGYGLPHADLIQEGNIGLMKAVKRFDPERGVRLVSFALHWIKAEIHEYILKNWRMVKVATTKAQRKLFFNLRSMKTGPGTLSAGEVDAIARELSAVSGIVVPGGFGARGVEGKIFAARYARERGIPYLGLCYGLHMAVIEFARDVLGLECANSTEIDPDTPHPVIDLMPDQRGVQMGGTMRLGLDPCALVPGTKAAEAYGQPLVEERHRHRWEVNNAYRPMMEAAGLIVSGASPDGRLAEIMELRDHSWYVGVQFHPEFTSRPIRPHPLFAGFVGAAARVLREGDQRALPLDVAMGAPAAD